MLTLSHTDDGIVKVEDKSTGLSVTVNIGGNPNALDQLISAVRYAASLPKSPAKPTAPARKPRAGKTLTALPVAAAVATSENGKPPTKPGYLMTLTEVVAEALTDKPMTLAALVARPRVSAAISSTDPKRQRASVAAVLTRLERAGTIVNIADTYKLKA